jgi:Co/Zn/Cd efflux system component
MAHHQKAVAAAVIINSAIFVVEAIAGYQADSLSLIMDSIHNLSDELALIFIYLAFVLSQGISRHLLRTANVFNSVGLVVVSVVLLWQSIERLVHPVPVQGLVVVAVGIAAAVTNWGVARLLLEPGRNNAAIRLAYIHNMGDVYVSLDVFLFLPFPSFLFLPPMTIIYAALHNKSSALHHIEPNHRFFLAKQH